MTVNLSIYFKDNVRSGRLEVYYEKERERANAKEMK